MTTVIINPGTGIRGDGNAPDGVAAALAKDASILNFKRTGGPDTDNYFNYIFRSPGGNEADVCIPSVPLERFHENLPVRVYIDGNSWMWAIAVDILLELDADEGTP